MSELLLGPFGRRLATWYGWAILLFIALPALVMVPVSFGPGEALTFPPPGISWEWYRALIDDPRWAQTAFLSLQVAVAASVMACVLGVAAAIGIARLDGAAARALKMAFIAPMIVPLMVMAVAFYVIYARLGLLSSVLPLALAHAVVFMPFVIMPVTARLGSLDPALEQAAASLGMGPYRSVARVILPLLVPAIGAAFVFAFILSFDEVVLAQFLSGPRFQTLPRKVWEGITQDGLDKSITAICALQLLLAVGALGVRTAWGRFRPAGSAHGRSVSPTMERQDMQFTSLASQSVPVQTVPVPTGSAVRPAAAHAPRSEGQRGLGISFVHLTKRYGATAAVEDVNLHINPGEFVTILGPSGSGKTTLLMLIAGFLSPDAGQLYLGDREISTIPAHRRDLGVVFQSYALFPHMNVRANVAFALRARRLPPADVDRRVAWALSLVHMAAYADRRIAQLSGGQQQRIALARAIAFNPRALLMDEPLAALDRHLRGQMQTEIRSLQKSLGQTVVFVTHDQEEALNMSDRVAVMNHGRVQQIASPKELYLKPANAFVAGFFGEANLFFGTAASDTLHAGDMPLPLPQPGTGPVALCVRPEVLNFDPAGGVAAWSIPARVSDVRFLGSSLRVEMESPAGKLIATRPMNAIALAPDIGAAVHVSWDPQMSHVMAREAPTATP